jgi:hypothetical protein
MTEEEELPVSVTYKLLFLKNNYSFEVIFSI